MENSGYPDLHAHIAALEKAGLLIRVKRPINKDSEMHPLVRWQFRGGIPEAQRKAFLFENVTDSASRATGPHPKPPARNRTGHRKSRCAIKGQEFLRSEDGIRHALCIFGPAFAKRVRKLGSKAGQ